MTEDEKAGIEHMAKVERAMLTGDWKDVEEAEGMSDKQDKAAEHFWVNGVVAVRNGLPYIQFSNDHGMIAQLDMVQARQVAADILQMAARAEADAMILKFFSATGMPENAGGMMMMQFREFRAELDQGDGTHDVPARH